MSGRHMVALQLAGLGAALGFAYLMDNQIEILRQQAFQNFSGTLAWLIPTHIAQLIMAGLTLALVWLFYREGPNGQITGVVYALVGLGILFYLSAALALQGLLPLPLVEGLVPGSFTSALSAAAAVMGLQRIAARLLAARQARRG